MKTKLYTIALIALSTLFTLNMNASSIQFEEENYIDDIPFDTEMIASNVLIDQVVLFEEEAYIDDIPFNTRQIADSSLSTETEDFEMEDEAYIDDIPFNTASVTAAVYYTESAQVHYTLEEESYIDDIPFNTEVIASSKNEESFSGMFMIASFVNALY